MQQAGTACLEKSFCLCNAAVHQHLSKSPAPVLGSSSLSIYPPIVSANNGALHIYSISHLGAGDKAAVRAGTKGHRRRVPNPGSCPRGCPRVGLAPDPVPGPSAWAPSKSADAARGVTAAPTRVEAAVRGHGRFTNEVLTPPGSSRPYGNRGHFVCSCRFSFYFLSIPLVWGLLDARGQTPPGESRPFPRGLSGIPIKNFSLLRGQHHPRSSCLSAMSASCRL